MSKLLLLPLLLLLSSSLPAVEAGCNVPISLPSGLRTILDLSPFLNNNKREISYSALTPPSLTTYTFAFGTCENGIGHDGTLEDVEQVSSTSGPSLSLPPSPASFQTHSSFLASVSSLYLPSVPFLVPSLYSDLSDSSQHAACSSFRTWEDHVGGFGRCFVGGGKG